MKFNTFYKKYENIIISVSAIALFWAFVCVKYDLIYELNDDAVIRNLLSGSYTGSPTAMNNQMMYIFSAAISLLYKIIPAVQWFDIFMMVFQYVCTWLILYRLMGYCKKTAGKLVLCAAYMAFVMTFLLNHYVLPTYTVTSGILAATAIFLFVTETDNDKLFRKSFISIFMAVLAFCIRSEILVMLLPFICVAGVYRWSREDKILSSVNFKKYFGIIGTMAVLLAAVFVTDNLAYSSDGWKDFRSFFDARTTVYDYTYIPDYEDNIDFYQNNNISKEQYLLLHSYDFALDEDINSEMMSSIADYAGRTTASLKDKLYRGIIGYKNQITENIGKSYHSLAVLGYLLLLLIVRNANKFRILFMAALSFFTRSGIWMYLIAQGRTPARITHPLYWAEFALLTAVFVIETNDIEYKNILKNIIAAVCITAVCVMFFIPEYSALGERYNRLYPKAQVYETVHRYCLDNSENFYFTPIYSMAVYPEMVFDGNEEPFNFDLLGGWIAKSPAHTEKMNGNGIQKVDDAIINNDNVYIIQHSGYVSAYTEYPFQWLTGYYAGKGYTVEAIKTDTIIDDIEVYKIVQTN